ncbi:5-methyltetrahydropteroyltriglutamate-- homocysteine [Candidatus Uzinura diaspidicola str. ASNER]|uniref:5-methyltetrahydropteroyltriglutamate--homocysteine methyltransferase n=1 Tax=Candidatus Uzinura diaspidicola str. ASNER TaxID=1133592 RepID=L7VJG1_9FLAO|nr:5-methyltetrahydropteroyltriglutamate-- homocysteine [Candidatus Uzinura diaspidicola str. ASNER]
MITHNLGYPRIGINRELKKVTEQYLSGQITIDLLSQETRKLRENHWKLQSFLDLIPCNDFSYYDQVLDMSFLLGAIPKRYSPLVSSVNPIDLYFAMARGYQYENIDIPAMEMTKWFDTNYHYIVPEFSYDQTFYLYSQKIFEDFEEAKKVLNKIPKPVLIGPVSYLLLGKEKDKGFHRINLLDRLLPVYTEIINNLLQKGAEWIQLDEPFLVLKLKEEEKKAFLNAYSYIEKYCPNIKILIATYFEGLDENYSMALSLPVSALHIDLVKRPDQLNNILINFPKGRILSLGLIDGRNIWKNDFKNSLNLIKKAITFLGERNLMIAPSCSLLHVPFDKNIEENIATYLKDRLAFANQKLQEIQYLKNILEGNKMLFINNLRSQEFFSTSKLIHNLNVKNRIFSTKEKDIHRTSTFVVRKELQNKHFQWPLFPTTTIGSFPQTKKIRKLRSNLKKGKITLEEYEKEIKNNIIKIINFQEEIGIDVLVHGELERNDMVEFFGEQLNGFFHTKNAWVQSYGYRCVKPPIIYGDVSRAKAMTVNWSSFAQEKTIKPMKGMLTGPLTILQWSFVRDDQDRDKTAEQIAWVIRDELLDLEKAGIRIIQIDEPALREGLPLKDKNWDEYFKWAIRSFRIASSAVRNDTQIHTHMCYSEFNEIMEFIACMDADVITIETSRSQMDLLEDFARFKYPNDIGPGIYDIHSPREPSIEEMLKFLVKATKLLNTKRLWVNPDCGLKTRTWYETKPALKNMVAAVKKARNLF